MEQGRDVAQGYFALSHSQWISTTFARGLALELPQDLLLEPALGHHPSAITTVDVAASGKDRQGEVESPASVAPRVATGRKLPRASVFVHSSERMPEVADGSVRLIIENLNPDPTHGSCTDSSCLLSSSEEQFIEAFAQSLPERIRVVADDGSFVLRFRPYAVNDFASALEYLLPRAVADAGFRLVQSHMVILPNPPPASAHRLRNPFGIIWHFARGHGYVFDKDAVRQPQPSTEADRRRKRWHVLGADPGAIIDGDRVEPIITQSPYDTSQFPSTSRDHRQTDRFQEGVAARFIKLLSRPGDYILDGLAGNGQVGVEALALGRRFVGFESHQDRAEVARARLGIDDEQEAPIMAGS